jgi:flagellar motor switch protein FliN/FliY
MDDELTSDEIDELSKAMEGPESEEEAASAADDAGDAEEGTVEDVSVEEPVAEDKEAAASAQSISHAQFMQLEEPERAEDSPVKPIERMFDVKVNVEVILGTTRMSLEEILKLEEGSVIELAKLAGEPVDILANGRLIARAEVVVIDDNFGVKIIEITGMRKFAALQA